ncbi:hypothetical protein M2399_004029 [Pseudomonas sp. BIGb0450]|nr:hypothetical protein [Pseudomonas sp. BIGb0558]MCS3438574.1 hypothetical protein [Pseudomonas sp. BIGb0450]
MTQDRIALALSDKEFAAMMKEFDLSGVEPCSFAPQCIEPVESGCGSGRQARRPRPTSRTVKSFGL